MYVIGEKQFYFDTNTKQVMQCMYAVVMCLKFPHQNIGKQVGLSRATLESQVKLDHFDLYRLDQLDLSLLDLSCLELS